MILDGNVTIDPQYAEFRLIATIVLWIVCPIAVWWACRADEVNARVTATAATVIGAIGLFIVYSAADPCTPQMHWLLYALWWCWI